MAMTLSPAPERNAITSKEQQFMVLPEWIRWFRRIVAAINAGASQLGLVALVTQGAAIAATDIELPILAAGLYRVTWYERVTRAATTSSSLGFILKWTDGGVAMTYTDTAITGNTTATFRSYTQMVRVDEGTTLKYQTTYASVGGTSMQYRLDVRVEAMP
jgi:hypothetical protein